MGFTEKTRDGIIRILNHALAEELHLSAITTSFLRQIAGPNSYSLQRLFGDQHRRIGEWLEEIKRHVAAAGAAVSIASEEVAGAAEATISEAGLTVRNMMGELLSLHEGVARRLRDDLASAPNRVADSETRDFVTRLVEYHETTAWMLRVLLEGSGARR